MKPKLLLKQFVPVCRHTAAAMLRDSVVAVTLIDSQLHIVYPDFNDDAPNELFQEWRRFRNSEEAECT